MTMTIGRMATTVIVAVIALYVGLILANLLLFGLLMIVSR